MRILALLTTGLLAACSSVPATEAEQITPRQVQVPPAAAIPALEATLRENGIVTAGFGVLQDGKLVWSHHYGEESPGKPADADSRFNVASITKLVAAETALRLVAAGELALDAPLASYWVDPDVAGDPRHEALTARIVLSHTTGFPNWRFFRPDGKLAFEHDPGARFGYSGEGFEWLARAIESKQGKPYEQVVQQQVFDPIGMHSAAIAVDKRRLQNIVQPMDADGKAHAPYCRPNGWCRPDGDASAADDMVLTVADMARFLGAVHEGTGYPPALARERNRVQAERGEDPLIDCAAHPDAPCPDAQGYGLGFEVVQFPDYTVIGHGGSDWAELTLSYVYQPSGDGLVVFLNAPARQAVAAMPALIEVLDPGSPYLPRYRGWAER